jgi:hypothetical protein
VSTYGAPPSAGLVDTLPATGVRAEPARLWSLPTRIVAVAMCDTDHRVHQISPSVLVVVLDPATIRVIRLFVVRRCTVNDAQLVEKFVSQLERAASVALSAVMAARA